jgi:hypothetical protein
VSSPRSWWFDLTRGLPTAVGALRRRLGRRRTVGLLLRFVWRRFTRRPFRKLERDGPLSPGERFTRHQLLPVLLLDDLLRDEGRLDPAGIHELLGQVVGESGAAYIRHATGNPSPEEWDRKPEDQRLALANRSLVAFGNIEYQVLDDPGSSFAFDVTHCHFVSLCHELGRPELASLFCRADEVLFGDPGLGVSLQREETLAAGDGACTFRLDWTTQRGGARRAAPDPGHTT